MYHYMYKYYVHHRKVEVNYQISTFIIICSTYRYAYTYVLYNLHGLEMHTDS
jgi:hypothetical protein